MFRMNCRRKSVIGTGTIIGLLIIHFMAKKPQNAYPIANFKTLHEVMNNETCFIYNQFRPINSGEYPEYERITPRMLIHSKQLFHGNPTHWVNNTDELDTFWKNQINGFPHFLFSGRQVVGTLTKEHVMLYKHWEAFWFVVNASHLISVRDVHLCKTFLSFYPLEKYDSNIKKTHKFFTKTYLPSFNVPLVENTTSYPMMLKCAELDGADEGVFFVLNKTRHFNVQKQYNCSNWIQQKYIEPNPFSTVDVNFYIHPNKSVSFIGVSPEIYLEIGSINSLDHNLFWLSNFRDIIHNMSSHIISVSNYSGFVCFDAVRTINGEWQVVDINVRLCGGHHHFMVANTMKDRNFAYWQYVDNLSTKQGLTCDQFMEIIKDKNKQSLCKCVVGSMTSKRGYCIPRLILFGTTKDNLSKCFPFGIFDLSIFDPREIIIQSDNKIMNDMMPIYLLKDF